VFTSVLKSLKSRFDLYRRESRRPSPRGVKRFRPAVNVLEERALMTAGALDAAFSADGKTQVFFDAGGDKADNAAAVAVQSDGKIVVVGAAKGPNGDLDFAIGRLLSDGSTDPSFGVNGRVRVPFDIGTGGKNDQAHAVVIQPDGKIVVVGEVERNSGDIDMGVIRLNADGTLDGGAEDSTPGDSFSTDGKATIAFDLGGTLVDVAKAVTLKSGKIVVAGHAQTAAINFDMAVAQLEADGQLDGNFSGDGRFTVAFDLGGLLIDQANAVGIQGDKIIVAGTAHTATDGVDMAVARINSGGTLDTTFSPNGVEGSGKATVGFNLGGSNFDAANAMVIQPDNKIVLAGTVARISAGDFDWGLVRLSADGALDDTFSGDGKAVVAFDVGGNKEDEARGLALQADGNIVVVGPVEAATGTADFGIARLTAAGVLDTTFDGDGKAVVNFNLGQQDNDEAAAVALDGDGKIVVVGTVQRTSAGDTDFGVVRLVNDPPPAPQVALPAASEIVNQASRAIVGTAAAGSLVRVYRDVNNNNLLDLGIDVLVGQQQLGVGDTLFGITVPLIEATANNFLATATGIHGESAAADVPTINEEGIIAKVVKRADGTSVVKVRGALTGKLRKTFGPYSGTVKTRLKDANGDGARDLVITQIIDGKKIVRAYNGKTLKKLAV